MILSKDNVSKLNESSLCQEILIPLLIAMGFRDVYYYHGGVSEQGKDIVCWKEDELGSRRNYALVVKAVKINGKAKIGKGSAGEISFQIQQCFGNNYQDAITSEPEVVHHCWVVSNKKIGKDAEMAIRSSLLSVSLERNIQFIGAENLWKYIEKYLPKETIINKLLEVGKSLSDLDTHYQPKITLSENSNINIEIVEKFPGASIEKPLFFKPTFQFPETMEGIAAKNALTSSFETGRPSDIPLQFLKNIELPEIISRLLDSVDIKSGVLHIGENINPIRKLVKLRVICDDGDIAEIDNVELFNKWQGSKMVTLENREPDKIFDLIFEFNLEDKKVTFSLKRTEAKTRNPHQLLQGSLFLHRLSRPNTIYVIDQITDLTIISMKTEGIGDKVTDSELEFLRDLDEIQKIIRIPMLFPMRYLTNEEKEIIENLRSILHSPKREGIWNKIEAQVKGEGLKVIIERSKKDEKMVLRNIFEKEIVLFGQKIPLGKVVETYSNAKVENIDEIVEKSKQLDPAEPMQVIFIPEGRNTATSEYLDWKLKNGCKAVTR